MNHKLLIAPILCTVSSLSGCVQQTENTDDPCPSLVGSWEMVSISESSSALSGEFESDPFYQEAPTLKILNETHWMFIRQSAESILHAQGGRYTLEPGGIYTEQRRV